MFLGVRSYENALACSDYEGARRALERASKTPTGRQRQPKNWGYHLGASSNHGVTWVREGQDGEIAFRLYGTDVVTWYPDNSVEIDNYGTVTTGGFARTFLPGGIHLSHTVERRGEVGGHRGVNYSVEPEPHERGWSAGRRICWGGLPRFRLHGDHWLPDEDTLDEISVPEITDRKGQREVSKQYSLRDFELWLAVAPEHMRIEHDGWDLSECADALLERDFRTAAARLPLIKTGNAFGVVHKIIPIVTHGYGEMRVTSSSLGRLKLALWERADLFKTVTFKTISEREFTRRMGRLRKMQQIGIPGAHTYGPR